MIVLTMARLLRKFEAPARGVLCRSCFSESRRYVTDAKVHGTGFLTERYSFFVTAVDRLFELDAFGESG